MDWAAYADVGWGDDVTTTNRHGISHQWRDGAPGIDTFNVYRRQFGDLKTYPAVSGTLAVGVSPYSLDIYGSQYQWPGIQAFPLDGALPAGTGSSRMVLVYWSPASGTSGYLGVATGTVGASTDATILNRPVTPVGAIPSAFVRLKGGQSSITEFDIWDAREPFRPGLSFGTGTTGLSADMIPISDTSGLYTGSTVEAALDQIGFDGARVSKVYRSNFGAVALQANATGDIGIGTTGPDAKLDVLSTTGAQIRQTFEDGVKFVDYTLDTNHDLTITPSSTGQIILQPTTDSVDFFQVLDADGGTPTLNVDSTNEAVSIKTTQTTYTFQGSNTQAKLFIEDTDAGAQRTIVFSRSSDNAARGGQSSYLRSRAGGAAVQDEDFIGYFNFEGHDGTDFNLSAQFLAQVDGAVSANTVPMAFIVKTGETGSGGLIDRLHITSDGDVGIGNVTNPRAQLDVDQFQNSEAQPVLCLDQADVDEPFTKYVGTAAAANLTRSIVDNGDVTTATLVGWTKIEIDDIGNQVTDGDYYQPFYSLA
jgi:hypothetical protein